MKFWSNLETDEEAEIELRKIRKNVEEKINHKIGVIILHNVFFQDWKWAFTCICMSSDWGLNFEEITKMDKDRKILEFRLHLNHKKFIQSDINEKYLLFINTLKFCVKHEKMNEWGFIEEDKNQLLTMLDNVEKEIIAEL